jgi:glycosyltransferase involved in cell wall biosynthesis
VRILLWHVHGSWTTAFVQGGHEYLIPVTPGRTPDGLGRAQTWDWPDRVREVTPQQLADQPLDAVVLQRPHELDLVRTWAGRVPGLDVPAIYLEHNTPTGDVPLSRHPLADRRDIPIAHVSHFNRLFWDCGTAPVRVIEHGVMDPGYGYTGDLCRAAVAVNEPVRRGRFVGTDLFPMLSEALPLDVFGMATSALVDCRMFPPAIRAYEDLTQAELHVELPRRRVYLHTTRWTSLGLSLIEAMMLGMPVVALGTTEAHRAVPEGCGVVSTDPAELATALSRFSADLELARETGRRARAAALHRYGLSRFLRDWDQLLAETVAESPRRPLTGKAS